MLEKEPIRSQPSPSEQGYRAPQRQVARRQTAVSLSRRAHEGDLQQRIQQRAYELWEREGRPEGREQAHWQQAQRELGAAAPAN